MGQKISANALRLGYIRDFESHWVCKNNEFNVFLNEDMKVRRVLTKLIPAVSLSKIVLERNKNNIVVFIHIINPGSVLGQNNEKLNGYIKQIQIALKDRKRNIIINPVQVAVPEIDSQLVANQIAYRLENRLPYKIIQKSLIKIAMKSGAKGIKTLLSGRLNGVDIARTEGYAEGTVSLSTFRNDIGYAKAVANTIYGCIGVKVWISKGEIINPKQFRRNSQTE